MKMKKIVSAIAALSLVAALAVGGTLAWLTDSTEEKTNTFTYEFGTQDKPISIEIKDEFPDGKMYPGAELDKNVGVTVKADSMNCYVYLEVQNGFFGTDGVELALDTTNWIAVDDGAGTGTTIYRYKDIVPNASADNELPKLLDKVTFSSDMTHDTLSGLDNTTIVVQAYAIQSDGANMTEDVADAAAVAWFAEN